MGDTYKNCTYKILPDLNLIIQYLGGSVNGEDAAELIKRLRQDDNYNTKYKVLVDFRDITLGWNQESKESFMLFMSFIKQAP